MHFLITWSTYGHWLPGDPRGFRTRRAKEFVPPPERYSDGDSYEPREYRRLYERCVSETRRRIHLNKRQKQVAADSIAEVCSTFSSGAVIAVTSNHVHLFINLPSDVTTGYFCSRVKSISSHRLSSYGLKGKVWARRYHAKQIRAQDADRVRRYVRLHEGKDAVVVESG